MGLTFRWVGEEDYDRVAQTRLYCYAQAAKELDDFKARIRIDQRAQSGDFLLAERDGVTVGTTTSLSMDMWVRGTRVPCQGVAFVGTIKTQRRAARKAGEQGIASQIMFESLRRGRERGQIVSALMPFRASYYEHFGYGMVERRADWTIPLSILPSGEFDGIRFMQPGDLPAVQACRQRMVEQGQCDIERTPAGWAFASTQWPNGLCVVDRPSPEGPVRSWMFLQDVPQDGKMLLRIADYACDSDDALLRQLRFLASLRDQYSAVSIQMRADLPLNWLLKETQLPHRPVEHPVARYQTIGRLQLRVLDHIRFIEALKLPDDVSGQTTVAVQEIEGHISNFRIEVESGRTRAIPAHGQAEVECADRVWAAVACGDLPATTAARFKLLKADNPSALKLLDALAVGPLPFCNERF